MTKRCTACDREKDVRHFRANPRLSTGRFNQCNSCNHAGMNRTELNRRYRERHPEKVRARSAVTRAIRRGELAPAKILMCVDCDYDAQRYDHYRGYAREHWLDVQPVCTFCCAAREKKRACASRATG